MIPLRMAATGVVLLNGPTRVRSENRLRWDLSPEQIWQLSDELIGKTMKMFNTVGSLDLDDATFSNTQKALAHAEAEILSLDNMLCLPRHVSPSKRLRAASTYACKKLSECIMEMNMRKDIHQRVEALSKKVDIDSLTSEDQRYLKRQLGYGRCVLHLPKDKHDEVRNIGKQLMQLQIVSKKQNFAKLGKLGARRSTLLGFKTHADSVLVANMANSAEKVSVFLDELTHKLKPLGEKERAILLKLKKEHCEKRCLPFNGMLSEQDLDKYDENAARNVCGVDHDRLKEYFPLEVVTRGLLDIFQDLLGLSFSLADGAQAWHPNVTLYIVTDRSSRETVGQFYLDLFTRRGKKGRRKGEAFCIGLQPGCLLSDGSRQMPVAAIVTNFSKPTSTLPCLLHHDEVLSLFHEFGHAMHFICAQVDYAAFSSFSVEIDFEEAPSQICENWAWEKEPLQRVSKHYRTGAPIPDDLLDKLIESRYVVTEYLQHIVEAKLDQALHTQPGLDVCKEYARLRKEILGIPASRMTISDVSEKLGLNQNQANHYRYLWGEMLAMDMFHSRFKRKGIMNPKVGLDYRNCILKPGASKDAEEMLKNFLGREPNQEAFLLSITTEKKAK